PGKNPRPATQGQNIYRNRVAEQKYFWKNLFLKYDIDSWTDFGIHIYKYRHSWTSFIRAPYYATQKFETWHYFWTIAFDLTPPDPSLTLETTYTGDSIDVLLLDPDFTVFHYAKLDIVDFQLTIPLLFNSHKYIYAIIIKWDAAFQYFSGFYRIDKPS
ncbi:unnamed protein product, partial [marine sediment metagenome]